MIYKYSRKQISQILWKSKRIDFDKFHNLLIATTNQGGATTKVSREGATLKHTAKVRPKKIEKLGCKAPWSLAEKIDELVEAINNLEKT